MAAAVAPSTQEDLLIRSEAIKRTAADLLKLQMAKKEEEAATVPPEDRKETRLFELHAKEFFDLSAAETLELLGATFGHAKECTDLDCVFAPLCWRMKGLHWRVARLAKKITVLRPMTAAALWSQQALYESHAGDCVAFSCHCTNIVHYRDFLQSCVEGLRDGRISRVIRTPGSGERVDEERHHLGTFIEWCRDNLPEMEKLETCNMDKERPSGTSLFKQIIDMCSFEYSDKGGKYRECYELREGAWAPESMGTGMLPGGTRMIKMVVSQRVVPCPHATPGCGGNCECPRALPPALKAAIAATTAAAQPKPQQPQQPQQQPQQPQNGLVQQQQPPQLQQLQQQPPQPQLLLEINPDLPGTSAGVQLQPKAAAAAAVQQRAPTEAETSEAYYGRDYDSAATGADECLLREQVAGCKHLKEAMCNCMVGETEVDLLMGQWVPLPKRISGYNRALSDVDKTHVMAEMMRRLTLLRQARERAGKVEAACEITGRIWLMRISYNGTRFRVVYSYDPFNLMTENQIRTVLIKFVYAVRYNGAQIVLTNFHADRASYGQERMHSLLRQGMAVNHILVGNLNCLLDSHADAVHARMGEQLKAMRAQPPGTAAWYSGTHVVACKTGHPRPLWEHAVPNDLVNLNNMVDYYSKKKLLAPGEVPPPDRFERVSRGSGAPAPVPQQQQQQQQAAAPGPARLQEGPKKPNAAPVAQQQQQQPGFSARELENLPDDALMSVMTKEIVETMRQIAAIEAECKEDAKTLEGLEEQFKQSWMGKKKTRTAKEDRAMGLQERAIVQLKEKMAEKIEEMKTLNDSVKKIRASLSEMRRLHAKAGHPSSEQPAAPTSAVEAIAQAKEICDMAMRQAKAEEERKKKIEQWAPVPVQESAATKTTASGQGPSTAAIPTHPPAPQQQQQQPQLPVLVTVAAASGLAPTTSGGGAVPVPVTVRRNVTLVTHMPPLPEGAYVPMPAAPGTAYPEYQDLQGGLELRRRRRMVSEKMCEDGRKQLDAFKISFKSKLDGIAKASTQRKRSVKDMQKESREREALTQKLAREEAYQAEREAELAEEKRLEKEAIAHAVEVRRLEAKAAEIQREHSFAVANLAASEELLAKSGQYAAMNAPDRDMARYLMSLSDPADCTLTNEELTTEFFKNLLAMQQEGSSNEVLAQSLLAATNVKFMTNEDIAAEVKRDPDFMRKLWRPPGPMRETAPVFSADVSGGSSSGGGFPVQMSQEEKLRLLGERVRSIKIDPSPKGAAAAAAAPKAAAAAAAPKPAAASTAAKTTAPAAAARAATACCKTACCKTAAAAAKTAAAPSAAAVAAPKAAAASSAAPPAAAAAPSAPAASAAPVASITAAATPSSAAAAAAIPVAPAAPAVSAETTAPEATAAAPAAPAVPVASVAPTVAAVAAATTALEATAAATAPAAAPASAAAPAAPALPAEFGAPAAASPAAAQRVPRVRWSRQAEDELPSARIERMMSAKLAEEAAAENLSEAKAAAIRRRNEAVFAKIREEEAIAMAMDTDED